MRAGRHRRGPLAYAGQRIGLLGGSFDPAHSGHLHVAKTSLNRLALDQVWWLVSPQNPLKPASGPFAERFASAQRWARGARMRVTNIESRLGLQYSADTIAVLQRRHSGVRFVWLMGDDNLAGFHRWRRWRDIAARVPIAIVARKSVSVRAFAAPAFARLRGARFPDFAAPSLARAQTPAWIFVRARLDPNSSTALRDARDQ